MAIGFMGVYIALLADHVNRQLEKHLLSTAIILGLASVVHWSLTDDLRFYFTVQVTVLASIPAILLAFVRERRQKA